jgi:hypothetical protein
VHGAANRRSRPFEPVAAAACGHQPSVSNPACNHTVTNCSGNPTSTWTINATAKTAPAQIAPGRWYTASRRTGEMPNLARHQRASIGHRDDPDCEHLGCSSAASCFWSRACTIGRASCDFAPSVKVRALALVAHQTLPPFARLGSCRLYLDLACGDSANHGGTDHSGRFSPLAISEQRAGFEA